MVTKIVKTQRRVQKFEKNTNDLSLHGSKHEIRNEIQQQFRVRCNISENYNDCVIDACSLCRQLAKDVDIHRYHTRTLSTHVQLPTKTVTLYGGVIPEISLPSPFAYR